ncbi:MAG: 16S rRNA (adenine(1518)-N(6)/adenine(1519)-N(6))-dimethyltransferase RsmA [Halobacteriota archaeon]
MVAPGERDPDALMRRAGVRGDPRRDQHFLIDDRVLDRIASYVADLGLDGGTVLEVGAGVGNLTDRLLTVAGRVVAVERDGRLAGFLEREFADAVAAGTLEVVHGDALEVDVPAFDAAAANLPYGVASEILFRLLPRRRPMVVMVQREFADRLCADAGEADYGRLTVTAWVYAESRILEVVPPTAFEPAPPVESAVVRLDPRPAPLEGPAIEAFEAVVRAVFTQRRKTLRNAIRNTTHLSGIDDPEALVAALPDGWAGRRPGELDPEGYVELAERAERVGRHP